MLSVATAEEIILELLPAFDSLKDVEVVDLEVSRGRILAQPVTGKLDFPHWDNSAMDGYAVRYEDVKDCSVEQPVTLKVTTEIAAGDRPNVSLQAGETARIFTGAMLPQGTDTIVIQENCR